MELCDSLHHYTLIINILYKISPYSVLIRWENIVSYFEVGKLEN